LSACELMLCVCDLAELPLPLVERRPADPVLGANLGMSRTLLNFEPGSLLAETLYMLADGCKTGL
jgi:hypothetical protein